MLRGAHEEKHGKRHPESRTRSQKRPARQPRRFGRHRRALLGARARPRDQSFLHAPDNSPRIQQHQNPIPPPMLMDKCAFDDSGLAFNTSTAQHAATAITTIAVIAYPRAIKNSRMRQLERINQRKRHAPNQQPPSHPLHASDGFPAFRASAARISQK